MNAVSSDDILGRIRGKRAEVARFLATAVPGQLAPQQAVGEFLKCVEDAAFLQA